MELVPPSRISRTSRGMVVQGNRNLRSGASATSAPVTVTWVESQPTPTATPTPEPVSTSTPTVTPTPEPVSTSSPHPHLRRRLPYRASPRGWRASTHPGSQDVSLTGTM